MKHLLTAIACCLAVAGGAQTPYNPDSDGNNLMGAEDLMSLLSLYGGGFYPQPIEPQVQVIALNDSLVVVDILESTDVVFITGGCELFYQCEQYAELIMPNSTSYKELTILSDSGLPSMTRLVVGSGDDIFLPSWSMNTFQPFRVARIIRSPSGIYHVLSIDEFESYELGDSGDWPY